MGWVGFYRSSSPVAAMMTTGTLRPGCSYREGVVGAFVNIVNAKVSAVMSNPAVFDEAVSLIASMPHLKLVAELVPPNHANIQRVLGAGLEPKIQVGPVEEVAIGLAGPSEMA